MILDADTTAGGVEKRWSDITSKLVRHHYDLPFAPSESGTVLPAIPHKPRIGVWLMPNNRDVGSLEDFLLTMVDEPSKTAAANCLESARQAGIAGFKEAHRSKALVHTYLAWQNPPGLPLGLSISSHALKSDSNLCHAFVGWLNNLFVD